MALTELFGFPPSGTISPSVRLLEKDFSFYPPGTSFTKTAFVGFCSKGPINNPQQVFNLDDLHRIFGYPHPESDHGSYMIYAAQEFLKYGTEAWILRIGCTDEDDWDNYAKTAYVEIPSAGQPARLRSEFGNDRVLIQENVNDKFRFSTGTAGYTRVIQIPPGEYTLVEDDGTATEGSLLDAFNLLFVDEDGIEAFAYEDQDTIGMTSLAFRTTKAFGTDANIEIVSVADACYETIGIAQGMTRAELIGSETEDSNGFDFTGGPETIKLCIRVNGSGLDTIDNIEQTIPFDDLTHVWNASSITPAGANAGGNFDINSTTAADVARYINWFIDNPTEHSYTVPGGFRAEATSMGQVVLYTAKAYPPGTYPPTDENEIRGRSALVQVRYTSVYVDEVLGFSLNAAVGDSGSVVSVTDGIMDGDPISGTTYVWDLARVTGCGFAAGTAPTIMTIWAESPGIEGNYTEVVITNDTDDGTMQFGIYNREVNVESHGNLNRDYTTINNPYYIERYMNGYSDYIYVDDNTDVYGLPAPGTYKLGQTVATQGSDGYPYTPDGLPDSTAIDALVIGNEAQGTGLWALSEPERIDIDIVCVPALTSTDVIVSTIELCQTQRRDCMAIIDTPYGLDTVPVRKWHNGAHPLNNVKFDSGYAALYWPWVKIFDSFNKIDVWVPPSGVVAGVYAKTETISGVWYAPAGLRRGTIPSAKATEKYAFLKERDTLYGNRNAVNVLVPFPIDGITVWGNKTLQRKPSALDRINVRRLMLYLEKSIASRAKYYLFEQHTAESRDAFVKMASNIMNDVKARNGLYDYYIKCDEELNTPEVIDRNEMRVKIGVQPVKAVEFIFIEFTVNRTGTFEETIV